MRRLALVLTLLPLAALAQEAEDETPTDPNIEMEDTCGAAGYLGLIGQTGEIARLIRLETPMRVIDPETVVTMEFRPERINFVLDDEDRIMRVECG